MSKSILQDGKYCYLSGAAACRPAPDMRRRRKRPSGGTGTCCWPMSCCTARSGCCCGRRKGCADYHHPGRRPAGQAQGVKKDLAMYLERFGDARVTEIRETGPRQESLFGQL